MFLRVNTPSWSDYPPTALGEFAGLCQRIVERSKVNARRIAEGGYKAVVSLLVSFRQCLAYLLQSGEYDRETLNAIFEHQGFTDGIEFLSSQNL
jgi:hypothetical protein